MMTCSIPVETLPRAISALQSLQRLDCLDINVQVALAVSCVTKDPATIPTIVEAGVVAIVLDLAKYAAQTHAAFTDLLLPQVVVASNPPNPNTPYAFQKNKNESPEP